MDKINEFLKALGPGRIAAMVGVSVFLLGFFAFVMMKATAPSYAPLFTDLSFEDQSAIVNELESQGIAYELRANGETIMVDKDEVARLRMSLASSGLPKSGGVGYEIFDKSNALGTTTFVQNINRLRALEGELSRSIQAISNIKAARVHLVIPEKKIFSRQTVEPKASIVIKRVGTVEKGQILAIQHLVAAAVPDLNPGGISIVDERGTLLSVARSEDDVEMGVMAEERAFQLEQRLENDIEEIITSVVGQGHTRVQVKAELDMNKITETEDIFDPESRVLRSSQAREENSNITAPDTEGPVSISNELPGAGANASQNGGSNRDTTNRTEETSNYEISRKTRTKVQTPGRIKKLSIAVLVDGKYIPNETEGQPPTYQPRTQEELDQIATLVRSAIGFDAERGDTVEVVNLPFALPPQQMLDISEPQGLFDQELTKDDIFRIAEIGVLGFVGLLAIFLVLRPMMKSALRTEDANSFRATAGSPTGGVPSMTMAQAPYGTIQLENGQTVAVDAQGKPTKNEVIVEEPTNYTNIAIENAQKLGQMRADSLEKVGELINNNPDEAVGIIRNWMADVPENAQRKAA